MRRTEIKILQSGLAKSANFWLWKIIQLSLNAAELPNQSFIQRQPIYQLAKDWELSYDEQAGTDVIDITPLRCWYRISSIFRMPITDFDAYLAQANHVWTHSGFNVMSHQVFPKFDKIVYIARDPRDVILSQSRFAFTPYRKLYHPVPYETQAEFLDARIVPLSLHWRDHVGMHLFHRETYNIHVVFYERLLADFDTEYRSLLDYLGIELDEQTIQDISERVTFSSMKARNPNHVRKGESNQWVSGLSSEQQMQILDHIRPLLELIGYPIHAGEMQLPAVPDDRELIAQATAFPDNQLVSRISERIKRLLP